jgi:hypothetical protein
MTCWKYWADPETGTALKEKTLLERIKEAVTNDPR